jgi:hypothetical protein
LSPKARLGCGRLGESLKIADHQVN